MTSLFQRRKLFFSDDLSLFMETLFFAIFAISVPTEVLIRNRSIAQDRYKYCFVNTSNLVLGCFFVVEGTDKKAVITSLKTLLTTHSDISEKVLSSGKSKK